MEKKETVPELTICAVYHNAQTVKYLELNHEFTRKMNSLNNYTWLVADNAPVELSDRPDPEKFRLIDGVKRADLLLHLPEHLRKRLIVNSFHHAAAIHRLLREVRTRFVLILDNDLYIVRPQWIRDVLEFMQSENLAFFGVPFHPNWWTKYRYFPSPNCFFIDAEKVNLADLDFNPGVPEVPATSLFDYIAPHLPPSLKHLAEGIHRRMNIGKLSETGYLVYRRFSPEPGTFEYALPVFREAEQQTKSKLRRTGKNISKMLLPDRWQYGPKNRASYVLTGFREAGYFDISRYGGEEYMWQTVPFCFHVRHFKHSGVVLSYEEEVAVLNEALTSFLPAK